MGVSCICMWLTFEYLLEQWAPLPNNKVMRSYKRWYVGNKHCTKTLFPLCFGTIKYLFMILPDKKMCSRSHAGILTNEESETLLQPRTSKSRSFLDDLMIRCKASSSMKGWDDKPSTTPATLSSSKCGNPWEVAYKMWHSKFIPLIQLQLHFTNYTKLKGN